MSQEIGVWLKGLLTWNVFIFLDLVIGTFGGGKGGRDLACTLSWQVLEWNREVRIQMDSDSGWGVGGNEEGSFPYWLWLEEMIRALRSESLHVLVSAKPCMLQGEHESLCISTGSLGDVKFTLHKVEKWPSSVQGSWLVRWQGRWGWGWLARHKTEAERGRKKESRRREKKGKRAEKRKAKKRKMGRNGVYCQISWPWNWERGWRGWPVRTLAPGHKTAECQSREYRIQILA